MELGIFARTFARSDLEQTLDAVKSHSLDWLQFNFSCAGLDAVPAEIEPALAKRIRSEMDRRSLRMAALSGTCNLIHPDPEERAEKLHRLRGVIGACPGLGVRLLTLCTGTRDPVDMWKAHPENHSPEAWRDLVKSLETLLPVAEENSVILGIEPEPSNVVSSAQRACVLLEDLGSPALGIVFDAANLVRSRELPNQEQLLRIAFDLLGTRIVLAHAKDVSPNPADPHVAAGKGALDYRLYVSLLEQADFTGPLILHGLSEAEVPGSVAFLEFLTRREPSK
jgi:sugar phosphate isomerase/epimerase